MMGTDLQAYLLSDRQWKRSHRIAHATMQLKQAVDETTRGFWRSVLEANGVKQQQRRGKRK